MFLLQGEREWWGVWFRFTPAFTDSEATEYTREAIGLISKAWKIHGIGGE